MHQPRGTNCQLLPRTVARSQVQGEILSLPRLSFVLTSNSPLRGGTLFCSSPSDAVGGKRGSPTSRGGSSFLPLVPRTLNRPYIVFSPRTRAESGDIQPRQPVHTDHGWHSGGKTTHTNSAFGLLLGLCTGGLRGGLAVHYK